MNEYVSNWLVGVGRPDLARKAERDELPELQTREAIYLFSEFQRKNVSSNDFLKEVLGIEFEPSQETGAGFAR